MAKRRIFDRLPVVHQLRQSVGLQRGMLVSGLVLTAMFLILAIFAPWIAPYGYSQLRGPDGLFGSQVPPNPVNLLGTTVGGYDVLSRAIWGAQTALLVIIVAILLSVFVGIFIGLLSGYLGGWVDRLLVVVADAIYAFPTLLLAIVAAIAISGGQSGLWPGVMAAAISITVVFIPQYFRVVRSEVVRVKAEAFIESAKVIGASTPNAVSARSRSSRRMASAPGRVRGRGPRPPPAAPPAPKKASMMSWKPTNGPLPGPAGPGPPPGASGSPPRSTICRFLSSESTSYAALMSLNFSCASGSGLTSGWYLRASLR